MKPPFSNEPSTLNRSALSVGTVVDFGELGEPMVAFSAGEAPRLCQLLDSGQLTALRLALSDLVLVWLEDDSGLAVVMGRVGQAGAAGAHDGPEELVLEARHSLVLRVGQGSITIREDGKILIKGKDLVSHAQRLNRIKGGAVSIN